MTLSKGFESSIVESWETWEDIGYLKFKMTNCKLNTRVIINWILSNLDNYDVQEPRENNQYTVIIDLEENSVKIIDEETGEKFDMNIRMEVY